jgi:hypothetical protein
MGQDRALRIPWPECRQRPLLTATRSVSAHPNTGVQDLDETADGSGLALIVVASVLLLGAVWLTIRITGEDGSNR